MKAAGRSVLTALFFMTGTMAFAENGISGTVKDSSSGNSADIAARKKRRSPTATAAIRSMRLPRSALSFPTLAMPV